VINKIHLAAFDSLEAAFGFRELSSTRGSFNEAQQNAPSLEQPLEEGYT
jgi:hypothetical protein